MIQRRLGLAFLIVLCLSGVSSDQQRAHAQPPPISAPFQGEGRPNYDDVIVRLMNKWGMPGAGIAVAKDGKLVIARGYGMANADQGVPATPETLFRIASVSKIFTAIATLQLVEQGKIGLKTPAFGLLADLAPPTGAADPRLARITVRELLNHTGGWDRDVSFDPMFIPSEAAAAVGDPAPASCATVIKYMWTQPLDFDPGARYAYSNFGYCVLGRVIERASGQSYSDYVQSHVLAPAGITRMRLGHTRLTELAPDEAHYYDWPGAPLVRSVFPDVGQRVPDPYGGFYIEAMDSHGGWIASAVDIVRLVTALSGQRGAPLLAPETVQLLTARPAYEDPGAEAYYAMGVLVRPTGQSANWWHTGSLSGTATEFVRADNGFVWAALFNGQPRDGDGFFDDLDSTLWTALNAVRVWPAADYFSQYP